MSTLYSKTGLQGAIASARIEIDDASPAQRLLLAERALVNGRWEEARELLEPLLIGQLRSQALVLRARVELGRDQADDGCLVLDTLVSEFGARTIPADMQVLYARYLCRRSGTSVALAFLEGAEPTALPEVIACRAVMLAKLRRYDEAARFLGNWMPRTPESVHPQLGVLLGRLLVLAGDAARAVRTYSRYLARMPAEQALFLRTTRAALEACNPITALQWLRVAQALGPSPRHVHELSARVYILNGDLSAAAHALRRALQLGGGFTNRILLAAVEIQVGHTLLGNTLLADVMTDRPDDPTARFWAAISARRAPTDPERGGALPVPIGPGDTVGIDAKLLRLFGILLFKGEFHAEAAICLQAVIERFPADAPAARYLAQCQSAVQAALEESVADSEAGSTFVIPNSFQLRPEAFMPPEGRDVLGLLAAQARVIGALVIRETKTRFAKHTLGHLWAVIELLIIVFSHAFFWYLMGTVVPGGLGPIAFLTTGILPFFMFQGVFNKMHGVIKLNRALLTYPNIKPLDLALARVILEYVTTILAFASCIVVLNVAGNKLIPNNPMEILLIMTALSLMGCGVGLIVEALSVRIESLKVVLTQGIRLLYFVSTIFYPFSQVPSQLSQYLWWNPIVHCVSLIRGNFSPTYYITGMSWGYITISTIVIFGIGLIAERAFRAEMLDR